MQASAMGRKYLFYSPASPRAELINALRVEEDSSAIDSSKKQSYLDLGVSYNSNNNLTGQFSNVEIQPAWSASASLTTKSGFDISLDYLLIQNSDTTYTKATSNGILDLGYSFDLLKYFNLRLAVNHTFQPKNTSSLKKGYDNSFYAGLGYDFNWLSGGLNSTYMLGNKITNKARVNSLSFNWSNNLVISIDNFLAEDNSLSFQPGFTLDISDQTLYNNYLLTALTSSDDYFGQSMPPISVQSMPLSQRTNE